MTNKQTAVVVQRVRDTGTPDTKEIKRLTQSAGYTIGSVLTQSRPEDREYNIGEGKVPEVFHAVQRTNASKVIVDNELGPYQRYNLGVYMPTDVEVMDRYGLVLDIFEQRATTKEAQLQVELANLRYELPRAEVKVKLADRQEHPGFMGLGEYDETRIKDLHRQIKRVKKELDTIEKDNKKRREQRRNQGFDLVAIAGYTNAGKSTLLRRLAKDHTVNENRESHADIAPTAESSTNLFTTLNTTTRRMDFDRRDVLLTDTVGFIKNLPFWLVEAFRATYDSIYRADMVLLVVDATNTVQEMRERLAACHNIFSDNDTGRILTVFNKTDSLTQDELQHRKQALSTLAPNPLCVSAENGTNTTQLKQQIHRNLPPFRQERLRLPLKEDTMSVVSWIHNNAYVKEENYDGNAVTVDFEARPTVVQKAHAKAERIVLE